MNYDKMLLWIGTHDVGVSSKTMWCALMGIANEKTASWDRFNVPLDADDFSRCYDLVTFCEVTEGELKKVVKAFPFYNPIIDAWSELVNAHTNDRKDIVNKILDSKYDEVMRLRGYKKRGEVIFTRIAEKLTQNRKSKGNM